MVAYGSHFTDDSKFKVVLMLVCSFVHLLFKYHYLIHIAFLYIQGNLGKLMQWHGMAFFGCDCDFKIKP